MVALARDHGLRFSFGAMVGETPILATAGSHFGAAHQDHLYIQGYSHRLLHRTRFVRGEPSTRRGGRVRLVAAEGLGLQIDPRKLDTVTAFRQTIEP
jgi:L-alanine-DL-glutamate epimerase-like enolase superfamily enzyme